MACESGSGRGFPPCVWGTWLGTGRSWLRGSGTTVSRQAGTRLSIHTCVSWWDQAVCHPHRSGISIACEPLHLSGSCLFRIKFTEDVNHHINTLLSLCGEVLGWVALDRRLRVAERTGNCVHNGVGHRWLLYGGAWLFVGFIACSWHGVFCRPDATEGFSPKPALFLDRLPRC